MKDDLTEFTSIRVTEEWLGENQWWSLGRAAHLYRIFKEIESAHIDLYYITGRYKDTRFWATTFAFPEFAEDPDLESSQREEALLWARENYSGPEK